MVFIWSHKHSLAWWNVAGIGLEKVVECPWTVLEFFPKVTATETICLACLFIMMGGVISHWSIGSVVSRSRVWVSAGYRCVVSNGRQVIYTYVHLSPSSIIWYKHNGWGLNRHITRCTSPVSMVLQCKPVFGWGLQKWSVPPSGPCASGRILLLNLFIMTVYHVSTEYNSTCSCWEELMHVASLQCGKWLRMRNSCCNFLRTVGWFARWKQRLTSCRYC